MRTLICAIQFGTSRISAVAAWRDDIGNYSIAAIESENTNGSIRHGCVISIDDAASSIKHVIQKLNNRLKNQNSRGIDKAYIGIGGISMHSLSQSPSIQLVDGSTVNTDTIDQLRKKSTSIQLPEYDILGIETIGYLLDKQECFNPEGRSGQELIAHHQLIVAQKRLKQSALAAMERAGLQVMGVIALPLATAQILKADEKQRGCILLDFGASQTTAMIYTNGVLRHLAVIPLGSDVVTRDIMSKNLSREESEQLKIQIGNANCEESQTSSESIFGQIAHRIPPTELNNIISCRYEEILANINRQIEVSQTKGTLQAGCIITGGAAVQKGLANLIRQRLSIPLVNIRSFTAFGYSQSERKPRLTSLLAMLLLCDRNCEVAISTTPAPAPPLPVNSPTGTHTVQRQQPVQQPVQQMQLPSKPKKRNKNKIKQFVEDLFSNIDDNK